MKRWLMDVMAIGGAGFFGSLARWGTGLWLNRWPDFVPWGTLLVNISGSLFLGWFMTVARERMPVSKTTEMAIAVGFVGAFTTFSSLMYETDVKFRDGSTWLGIAYLAGSIVLGLVAVRVGILLGQPH